jgi:hypothetical protein
VAMCSAFLRMDEVVVDVACLLACLLASLPPTGPLSTTSSNRTLHDMLLSVLLLVLYKSEQANQKHRRVEQSRAEQYSYSYQFSHIG